MMISNEKRIYDKLIEVYPEFLKPITQLSMNTSGGYKFLECDFKAFDFDDVKNCHENGCEGLHSSPDALFNLGSVLYFIEFKEGKSETVNIRVKIHEAVATLHNFCKKHLPDITKESFFKLSIKYAVMCREGDPVSFTAVLSTIDERYKLENLKGHILTGSKVMNCPETINKTLLQITSNMLTSLTVHNRTHPSTVFNNR
jgi:hypothetical protein